VLVRASQDTEAAMMDSNTSDHKTAIRAIPSSLRPFIASYPKKFESKNAYEPPTLDTASTDNLGVECGVQSNPRRSPRPQAPSEQPRARAPAWRQYGQERACGSLYLWEPSPTSGQWSKKGPYSGLELLLVYQRRNKNTAIKVAIVKHIIIKITSKL